MIRLIKRRRFAFENTNNPINSSATYFDVIIIGAGPAGCTAALGLKDAGLRVLLVDKSDFPRDKVCGDAIGSRAIRVLKSIDRNLAGAFEQFPHKVLSSGWKLVAPNGRRVKLSFVNHGYVSTRLKFDAFLFDCVKQYSNTEIRTGEKVSAIEKMEQGWRMSLESGESYSGAVILGCDGAQGVTRKLTNQRIDPQNYSGAVRAYFENIAGLEEGIIEIYLDKNFLPGYFWIFPLGNNLSNVGFGMLSSEISKQKVDLKKALNNIISSNPELKKRFQNALQTGDTKGFGLPLGGKRVTTSGERFLLCGDSAALIDPLNGEGIGNAMLSGKLAADVLIEAFKKSDFSQTFFQTYDSKLEEKLRPELRSKLRMQKAFNRTWLINFMVLIGSKSSWIREAVGKKL